MSTVWMMTLIGFLTPFTTNLSAQDNSFGIPGEVGFLGIQVRNVLAEDLGKTSLSGKFGVFVEGVIADTPAAQAGIREGDILTVVAGVKVLSARQFTRLIGDLPPGRIVQIDLVRGGAEISIEATVGERPAQSSFLRSPNLHSGGRIFRFDGEPRHGLPHFGLGRRPEGLAMGREGPLLGIEATNLTEQMAEFLEVPERRGVLVMAVLDKSPAANAGFQAGDVIVSVDGNALASLPELKQAITDYGSYEVVLVRKGRKETVSIEIQERPNRQNRGQDFRL